jgi:hypothetical protein
VPTDPFVNPDIDDRPRQQQNLPPGVAYPPPGKWVSDRPGDVVVGQPRGPLMGDPGPNGGYAYTLAERARKRLRLAPGESADDALSVVAEIAARRATSFGRAPVVGDLDVALTLLGYEEPAAQWAVDRARLVHGAAHHYQHRRVLVSAVPDELLGSPTVGRDDVEAWRRTAAEQIGAH